MYSLETRRAREVLDDELQTAAKRVIDETSAHGVFIIGFVKTEEGLLSMGRMFGELVPNKHRMPAFLRRMAEQVEAENFSAIILPPPGKPS